MNTVKFIAWASFCVASGVALKVSPKIIQRPMRATIMGVAYVVLR